MWPPVGAFMWMQHAKSRLQDHHRERVYSSRHIRRLFGVYPRYPQIFAPYSRAVCHVIFAAIYSQLSAVYPRLFCFKRITRISTRIIVNIIWNKLFCAVLANKRVDVNNVRISPNKSEYV